MLEEALDPTQPGGLPCLSGIPAYISYQRAQESGTTLAAWRKFFAGVPGYNAIFGGIRGSATPLIRRLDTIITGVGTIVLTREAQWRETGDFIKERLDQDCLSKQEMHRLIYGDIGGILLAREGLSAGDMKQIDQLNAGWMGMRLSHWQAVARAAAPKGAPGVIVVAYGPWKAEMVRKIIQLGLVNQLIVDATLADALLTEP